MTEGKTGQRLRILAALVAFLFAALTTRLWFLQVLASEALREQANRNRIRLVPEDAPRGRILDRDGEVLVKNRLSLVVMVNRQEVEDPDELLFELSEVLDEPVDDLLERYNSPRYYQFTPIPLAFDVTMEEAFTIAEYPDRFSGATVEKLPVRDYPLERLAVHVLGYTREIEEGELAEPEFADYEPGDRIGKSGVERSYEPDLRGMDGVHKLEMNAAGRILREIGAGTPPVPGNDVVLSIDADVQALAEESLLLGIRAARQTVIDEVSATRFKATAGAVVVMDPGNGQVLAMASYPSYDPGLFLGGLTAKELARVTDPARNNPLFNRATQGEYPPGSTFKPFIALSAIKNGIRIGEPPNGRPVTPGGSYPCPAVWFVPEDPYHRPFSNWRTVDSGYISLSRALAESCDTVFYPMGYDYWRIYYPPPEAGPPNEPLQEDLRRFGFDRPTLVDLPFEKDARIPDSRWKAAVHRADPKNYPEGRWQPGDFVNMSIGQGDVLVTPLQLTVAFSAIANGGTVWVPHVALRIQKPDGTLVRRIAPRRAGRLPLSPDVLAFVRKALEGVVRDGGTAEFAFRDFPFSRVNVAAKTGTAEVPPHQDHSWFAAMAPAEAPRYVVVAIVEQAGHGSTTAAPIVRHILEGLFGLTESTITTQVGTD